MTPLQKLQSISFDFKEPVSMPVEVTDIYQPKDMNNITHEDIQKVLESIQMSNAWIAEQMQINMENMEICTQDLENLSEQLKSRRESFRSRTKIVINLSESLSVVVNSVAAIFIAAKTKMVVAAVFFEPRAWYEKLGDYMPSRSQVSHVVSWASGFAVGVMTTVVTYEIMKRADTKSSLSNLSMRV